MTESLGNDRAARFQHGDFPARGNMVEHTFLPSFPMALPSVSLTNLTCALIQTKYECTSSNTSL
jgi:hypothetical protein